MNSISSLTIKYTKLIMVSFTQFCKSAVPAICKATEIFIQKPISNNFLKIEKQLMLVVNRGSHECCTHNVTPALPEYKKISVFISIVRVFTTSFVSVSSIMNDLINSP